VPDAPLLPDPEPESEPDALPPAEPVPELGPDGPPLLEPVPESEPDCGGVGGPAIMRGVEGAVMTAARRTNVFFRLTRGSIGRSHFERNNPAGAGFLATGAD